MTRTDQILVDVLHAVIPESDLLRAANAANEHGAADILAAALARAGYEGPPSERPRYYVIGCERHGNAIVRAINSERARAQVIACGVPEAEIIDSGLSADIPPRLAREDRATPLVWGFELLDQDAEDPPADWPIYADVVDEQTIARHRELCAAWRADSTVCPRCGHNDLTLDVDHETCQSRTCQDCGLLIETDPTHAAHLQICFDGD